MACSLHVHKVQPADCTCANTHYSQAIERVRIALHATHWPGSYGDHSECCEDTDRVLDQIRRMEQNPAFLEEDPYEARYGRAPF